MDGGAISGSLDRIEAALSRITAAVQAQDRESHPPTDLSTRHELLKHSVSRSIAALDALIAGEDR